MAIPRDFMLGFVLGTMALICTKLAGSSAFSAFGGIPNRESIQSQGLSNGETWTARPGNFLELRGADA
eukprot:CAMPEP_0117554356 /NCGR_PEP_ID=MMETSP0784-20121206/50712_1 /TAXON_ID=39447 /ORGANISM="" /LENGTH=67 /DNA_ID=CAMNT_0005351519 /DNA_START=66 /DNA_END=265 /DNA_ORIENTATION=-